MDSAQAGRDGSRTRTAPGMKILFITSNRLGDAVLSTGLLDHLIRRHPGARITIACGPVAVPLFAEAPGIERVIALTKKPYSGHWLDLWRQTAFRVWDRVVDLRASGFVWTVLAKDRCRLVKNDAPVHRLRLLADVLGLEDIVSSKVWTAEEHHAAAADLIPPGPVLGIGPTANWGGKQWPAESFVDLIRRLRAPGQPFEDAPVAVFGGPGERGAAGPVLESLAEESRIDLVGKAGLLTVAACLERCALYIGNDSGLMHLAAAAGAPTLGLFGPSREVHYAPFGAKAAFVRTPESYEQILYTPGYDFRSQQCLMGSLEVDTVVEAAQELLARLGGAIASPPAPASANAP